MPLLYHSICLYRYVAPKMPEEQRLASLEQQVQGVYRKQPDGGRGIVVLTPEGERSQTIIRVHQIMKIRYYLGLPPEPMRWWPKGKRPD